ncbi:dihydrodipicolinate synthase family protein [Microbacterium esteraromaticum]|uniref:Dihydrodipicolinate synthase family protein n=1 Tax=Microbacterium esteraromaticum TaxID=57043 RepID=A0A939DTD0_9MICO|nr:dihydrodipicolinate synthase family protein [Microbacterium esteraromaticum]MBN8204806.1 dihydrodipicolinate synthase family protein [Microbacterium esteraromaticum]MBN8414960.1 dihydrodipicolinate synthase family protein [Microbacterium esteraromaticum]MBN8424766.1 dihydrodipicolinate synthase family protein [Microbacterium esteraromaticum]
MSAVPALRPEAARTLAQGAVIPAHPLALTADRTLDERRQRALTRYYLAAGAGGLAVGVHTTQFEIRDPEHALFEPVLALAAEELDAAGADMVRIAGVAGGTAQAVAEAELARSLGYDAVLVSPRVSGADERALLDRARAVGEVLPVVGFYLQTAIGGPVLDRDFWRDFASIPSVVAVKAAPFDRYRTLELVRGVAASGRADEIALYTGNDDAIVADLLSEFHVDAPDGPRTLRFVGGLLGQWAVGTRAAVAMLEDAQRAARGDVGAYHRLGRLASDMVDVNQAVFDPGNDFHGVIAGVHEMLRQQGLLEGTWCLDPAEGLSPGQAEEITRVRAAYPQLNDDAFIAENLEEWLR